MNRQEFKEAWHELRRLKHDKISLPYIPPDLSIAFQCMVARGKSDPLACWPRRDSNGTFLDSGGNFTQAVFWTLQAKANSATTRLRCEEIMWRRGY